MEDKKNPPEDSGGLYQQKVSTLNSYEDLDEEPQQC